MISTAVQTHEQTTPSVEEMKRAASKQAIMRNLTPAQLRAVAFAQQQVVRAQQARAAKNEREAARNRMWVNSEIDETEVNTQTKTSRRDSVDADTFSLRKVQGSVLRLNRVDNHPKTKPIFRFPASRKHLPLSRNHSACYGSHHQVKYLRKSCTHYLLRDRSLRASILKHYFS